MQVVLGQDLCNMTKYVFDEGKLIITNHGKSLISHKVGMRHLWEVRKPVSCISKPGYTLQWGPTWSVHQWEPKIHKVECWTWR